MLRAFRYLAYVLVVLVVFAMTVHATTAPDGHGEAEHQAAWPAQKSSGMVAKLTASDGTIFDGLGTSVAVTGDTIVAGAPDADAGATTVAGAVYLYRRNQGGADNWGEALKLIASDATTGDDFGFSAGIDGDTLVVGAPHHDGVGENGGAAYVFVRNHGGADTWGEIAILTAPDGVEGDGFGRSVSISRDRIVVGAYRADGPVADVGAAYLFERNMGGADSWGFVKKLVASDAAQWDDFGDAVEIFEDTLVVGGRANDDAGPNSGSAYVFQRNEGGLDNWGEVQKLTASDPASGDSFADSLAVHGDTIVIGAYLKSASGFRSGAAYIYSRNFGGLDNWGQVKRILASDASSFDNFGAGVAVEGDVILVGASGADGAVALSGAAYLFERNAGGADNWGEVDKFSASDGADNDVFGWAVALDGPTMVVGVPSDDDLGGASGSAYVFDACGGGLGEWHEVSKATASDAAAGDIFGWAVAGSGDTFVVGAYRNSDAGSNSGSAYLFERNQGGGGRWGEVRKLTASDAAGNDEFGYSVAISGDTALVGADGNNGLGAAYVFFRNQGGVDSWGEVAKLVPSDGLPDDWIYFGTSVAISGSTAVVGAYGDDDAGPNSGSAYVFERNQGGADSWGEVAKLTASDAAGGDWFGDGVSISGDTVVVTAQRNMDAGADTGSAYVFSRNQGGADSWGEVAKLLASDATAGDWFGKSAAISGDTVVVGAMYEDSVATDSGSAYVFSRNQGGADSWGEVTKLVASDAQGWDFFGWSVAISGDMLVVGANQDDHVASNAGSAYVFSRNQNGADNWGEVTKLVAADSAETDSFGVSVAITGDKVVVGAEGDDDDGPNSGSAYVFRSPCWLEFDFGDTPDPTYPTLLASDGARHLLGGTLFMGATVDADADGQPSGDATGDDTDPEGDDEDGVVFTSLLIPGGAADVDVEVSELCYLNAWVDFNSDGDWDDAGEQVFTDEALGVGVNPLVFDVPGASLQGASTFARFRVDSSGGLSFTGVASDGEVEDYQVAIEELDFGDAPDPTFPTLFASDGARHVLGGALYMGAAVDADADGQPSGNATGDDTDAQGDDEDGVVFTSLLIPGVVTDVEIEATAPGLLNAWIDFNGDGDWADAGEQIFADEPVAAGINPLSFAVPSTAAAGTYTFARFRVDSAGGLSFDGEAPDGEVEDEYVLIEAFDFGDAPDPTYPTLLASDGARHVDGVGLFLGATADNEPDGLQSALADGDDLNGADDEDGVVFAASILAGAEESFQVTASAVGMLNAWIDFNADGDWDDAGEQVFTDELLVAGGNGLSVMIPLDAAVGTTFARFRFDSAGGLSPTGLAVDGEVEDYLVVVDPSAELEVGIADSPDPVPEGGRLTYFVSVGNNGQLEATSVVLADTLPPEVSFVAASHPGCVEAGGVVTCDLATLAAGGSTMVEIEVDLAFGTTGTITNSAEVTLNETDPIAGNNTDSEVTTVVDEPTYIYSDGFETGDTSRWSLTSP